MLWELPRHGTCGWKETGTFDRDIRSFGLPLWSNLCGYSSSPFYSTGTCVRLRAWLIYARVLSCELRPRKPEAGLPLTDRLYSLWVNWSILNVLFVRYMVNRSHRSGHDRALWWTCRILRREDLGCYWRTYHGWGALRAWVHHVQTRTDAEYTKGTVGKWS